MGAILAPAEDNLEAFWVHAVNAARLNPAEAVMGQDDFLSLRPPHFSYGETAEEADVFCAAVLAGSVRQIHTDEMRADADATDVDENAEAEGATAQQPRLEQPRAGDLAIVCDGAGIPRALIVTERVQVLPDNGVTEYINVLYPRKLRR
ncbi:MAG: hypothetical protein PT944_04710 [Actinomycetaceae bacterium]|nr:hypothetical protein [Arcanobacterium sp.]MDD7687200.1 hypothetical protein [Actinomycetaceae bacterium]MDY5273503.1 hypothetical protein [Arcanobacterium sp.]